MTGTLTLTNGTVLNLDAADLMSGSLTLDNQCVTGEELAFGCAYLGQAALNLRTVLSRHAFFGAKLVLHYGLQLPGGRWETVPLGVYTVAEAERRALYVSIKAYDNILALQQKYDGTTMQGTAYALLGQIAAACGLYALRCLLPAVPDPAHSLVLDDISDITALLSGQSRQTGLAGNEAALWWRDLPLARMMLKQGRATLSFN